MRKDIHRITMALAVLLLVAAPLAAQNLDEPEQQPAPAQQEQVDPSAQDQYQETQPMNESEAPDQSTSADADADRELPRTASPLALLLLGGLAGGGSALGLRLTRGRK